MKRREFITGLGGAAASLPFAARAQQPNRMRRIGVLQSVGANDPEGPIRMAGFLQGLQQLGWANGRNLKWLELLKEIAPRVTRVAVLRDPALAAGTGQFGAIQSVAPSFGVELNPVNVRDPSEIERAVTAFARSANGGMIVTASPLALLHRELIVKLAARHEMPAVYNLRSYVTSGGLISYGPDIVDNYRRAAGYVDRVLKGEQPADLPVQAPTKFELVINLKTAKALGIEVSANMVARADAVIE